MSISISKGKERPHAEPNVVPLCDVLLVLLIIFMVVTPLVQKGVDVRLPAAMNTANMPENPDVVVYLKKDGTIYLNQDKVTNQEALQSMLEEAFLTVAEKKLYLKADGDLEYGVLIDLYVKIRAAGIENIAIITDKKTEKG
ncbi:MAG: biopolymer transporter ExbD [Candidatus Aminicenantes bacterium]|nr:biopolymer transporter ExbD [Candidatus Aminicenantes bacterium]